MTIISAFESAETTRGVLALESVSLNDWGGLILASFDTTNTPEVRWDWQSRSMPARDIDATLREAFDQYDGLLRRLSD